MKTNTSLNNIMSLTNIMNAMLRPKQFSHNYRPVLPAMSILFRELHERNWHTTNTKMCNFKPNRNVTAAFLFLKEAKAEYGIYKMSQLRYLLNLIQMMGSFLTDQTVNRTTETEISYRAMFSSMVFNIQRDTPDKEDQNKVILG